MACKKSELISAINTFASARATGDSTLVAFSGNLVGQLVETLEFDPEVTAEEEENVDQSDTSS